MSTPRSTRLTYHPPAEADVPEIAVGLGDWDVASMTSSVPWPLTEDGVRVWMDGLRDRGDRAYLLRHRDHGALVGCVGLTPGMIEHGPSEDPGQWELGYWIAKPLWGQGFASEAAAAMIAFGRDHLGVQRISAGVMTVNPASVRVLEKLGFEEARLGTCRSRARGEAMPAQFFALDLARSSEVRR